MSKARPVLIAAGGTGGHIIPGLAVADALTKRQVPVVWAGTPHGLEARLVPSAGIALSMINVRGLRGQSLRDTLLGPVRLARAIVQSVRLLRRERVAAVLGMGGFVSGPVAIAALALRVPLVLHEQNAVPGMTNAWLARFARRVFSAFPNAFATHSKAEVVGNPVPHQLIRHDIAEPADTDLLKVLVIGGSRGAEFLNRTVPEAIVGRAATSVRISVRHQAGAGRADATRARYADAQDTVVVSEFIDDMVEAYRAADLVISRAGAMTVTELAASGTASLLVPYPYAVDDHQTANANWLVSAGAARLLPEADLDAERLRQEIDRLAGDPAGRHAMARAAQQCFLPGAADRVADALVEVSGHALGMPPASGERDKVDSATADPMKPSAGGLI